MAKFYLDTHHPDKYGECPIRVSTNVGGKRFMTSIGYNTAPQEWRGNKVDPGTKKNPKANARGIAAAAINARIAAISAAFSKLDTLPEHYTVEDYRKALKKIIGKPDRARPSADLPEVLAAFDAYIKDASQARQWTTGTHECWHAFRNHLVQFNPQLTFADLNGDGLTSFVAYLRTRAISETKAAKIRAAIVAADQHLAGDLTKEDRAKAEAERKRLSKELAALEQHPVGMEDKTAHKHFRNLKSFLNWATKKKYPVNRDIDSFETTFKEPKKPVVFLTRPELLQLYNYEIPANGTQVKLTDTAGNEYTKTVQKAGALEKARDLFIFCAFTSLRYSDMAKLKRSDIVNDHITITTKKTNDRLTIRLNDYSRAILDKYAGYHFPKGLALPVISNQKMNDYLKDLCELCNFREPITRDYFRAGQRITETWEKWQLVSTHAGRRSFVCNALTRNIAPQVIMKWTGHSDYKAMKPYIDIASQDLDKAMELMND